MAFDFQSTYIDELESKLVEQLQDSRSDWGVSVYSDEFEDEEAIIRLAQQVITTPKILVNINEGQDMNVSSDFQQTTDRVVVDVLVCNANRKGTAEQKRETLRIAMYVRKYLSGFCVDFDDAPAARSFVMPDSWEVTVSIPEMCVVTATFRISIPTSLTDL